MFDRQTKKFCSAVVDALPELSPNSMQRWIGDPKGLKRALRGVLCLVLSRAGTILIPAMLPILTVKEFFTTREGLWVSDRFGDNILASIKKERVEDINPAELSYYDLPGDMGDYEIREGLPDGHVFENPLFFCIHLAILLIRQWNGEEGPLLTSGYVNLFYVKGLNGKVFVVGVNRYVADGGWSVDAADLGGYRWRAGGRVFSRN